MLLKFKMDSSLHRLVFILQIWTNPLVLQRVSPFQNLLTSSADTDQTAPKEQSDLCPHCLLKKTCQNILLHYNHQDSKTFFVFVFVMRFRCLSRRTASRRCLGCSGPVSPHLSSTSRAKTSKQKHKNLKKELKNLVYVSIYNWIFFFYDYTYMYQLMRVFITADYLM